MLLDLPEQRAKLQKALKDFRRYDGMFVQGCFV